MSFQLSTYEHLTGATKQTPAYSCVAQGNGFFFAKKGAMVADQGNFKYEKILLDPNAGAGLARGIMNSVTRRLTGENMEIMKVTGSGMCILAFAGKNVTIIPLQPGEQVGVESENILAFTGNLKYGVRFIGAGVLSQKGLFTTNFQNNSGEVGYIAVITDGNAIVLQTPCRVDPDAIICWTGPDPTLKADVNWKTFIGQTSGESYMFEFKQSGQTVVLQPSERKAGLDIGIDRGEAVGTQSSAFGNSMDNVEDTIGQVTNTLGRFFNNR
ncbi:AIM24 family protein [Crassaminicella thermophila]|uniref:AIM24 family protein n=1 Tax=Crassaminicella thermophila TaxID=2599308 RepID=A0A5C0S995_CRATE|nr:AIM24 family protein [Crassaminicella thermophila]QEK11113.1 AIM24 family protein [Crassaminicella thermophila]